MRDDVSIRFVPFDNTRLKSFGPATSREEARKIVDQLTETRNRQIIATRTEAGGTFIFVVQSERNDAFLESAFKTLGKAAKNQLTRTRGGVLIAGLSGVPAEQLLSVIRQDFTAAAPPTELRRVVSKFLGKETRDHVVGLGILSSGSIQPAVDGVYDSGGLAYHFPNEGSIYWHEDYSGIFAEM